MMAASRIAAGLAGARKVGFGWMACCPAHDDREPSLSICDTDDGKVLVFCHAGCSQARVISALMARGLWLHGSQSWRDLYRARGAGPAVTSSQSSSGYALQIGRAALSASGTLVQTYLRSRGINLVPPPSLLYHPRLKHPTGCTWPAMVAIVTQGIDGTPMAIHRTFLARNGKGKAPVEPQKMMLGPCRGGAVRLALTSHVLMVGEGIETCLAAMQATGKPAWAALTTSGFRSLQLPASVREVIVLADGDAPGEAAAQRAALRWKSEGRRVRIARPPEGLDFADLLNGRDAAQVQEVA